MNSDQRIRVIALLEKLGLTALPHTQEYQQQLRALSDEQLMELLNVGTMLAEEIDPTRRKRIA